MVSVGTGQLESSDSVEKNEISPVLTNKSRNKLNTSLHQCNWCDNNFVIVSQDNSIKLSHMILILLRFIPIIFIKFRIDL